MEGETFELVEGQGDPPLSEAGRHQAELVGLRLAQEPFDALYVSTLQRTAQTAAPLVARCGMTPVVDADLREVFLGDWEGGLLRQKAADGDPLFERMLAEQRWDVCRGPSRARSSAVGCAPRSSASPGRIPVGASWSSVTVRPSARSWPRPPGRTPFAFVGPDNASISRIVVSPERWIIRGYNDTSHLAG